MNSRDQFSSDFECEIIDYPMGEPDYTFAAPGAGARATTVQVTPSEGTSWTGAFSAPDPGIRPHSAVVGTPHMSGLCVIERGTAFIGDVRRPQGFVHVPTDGPVVQEVAANNMLLLVTPWSITAIGKHGIRWTTRRISVDGLRIDEVSDSQIKGVADPLDFDPRNYIVDLESGDTVGGADLT